MDQDDPETRIAELERRLADQQRAAQPRAPLDRGPDLSHPGHSRGQRRNGVPGEPAAPQVFVATVLNMKWSYPKVFGLIAVLCGGPFVVAVPLLLVVAEFTRSQRLRSYVRGEWPQARIRVAGDGIEISRGPRRSEVFPRSSATLGPWTAVGKPGCTALHLRNDRRRYIIGGLSYRVPAGARLDAQRVWAVDASMPTADFDALLGTVFR